MKWILAIIAVAAATGIALNTKTKSPIVKSFPPAAKSFAVLELFTSEGCSSCPSADKLLPVLMAEDSNIIALSFHVDYWDHLGWKDAFSSAANTERQRKYAQQFRLESIYTPQLVINGQYEAVGSNKRSADASIQKVLAQTAVIEIKITDAKKEGSKLNVNCELSGEIKGANLVAAIVQKSAERKIKGGENSGAKLLHTNVVRSFIEKTATSKMNFIMDVPSDLADDNWQLILYTQNKADFKITGAAKYQ